MSNNGNDHIQILVSGCVIKITEDAVLVEVVDADGVDVDNETCWFPKSQISGTDPDDMEVQDDVEFYVPEWLADEKELF